MMAFTIKKCMCPAPAEPRNSEELSSWKRMTALEMSCIRNIPQIYKKTFTDQVQYYDHWQEEKRSVEETLVSSSIPVSLVIGNKQEGKELFTSASQKYSSSNWCGNKKKSRVADVCVRVCVADPETRAVNQSTSSHQFNLDPDLKNT